MSLTSDKKDCNPVALVMNAKSEGTNFQMSGSMMPEWVALISRNGWLWRVGIGVVLHVLHINLFVLHETAFGATQSETWKAILCFGAMKA